MRRKYYGRFWCRILILCGCIWLYFVHPESFRVLEPGRFFCEFSPLHILWVLWMGDMVLKLFPVKGALALGAVKHLKAYYVPAAKPADQTKALRYFQENNKRALIVFAVWCCLGIVLAVLRKLGILEKEELFLITVFFYVCDLICVLIWCPFRVWFLKNRCCTTCRIFNWDHFMMVTPLICVKGFYSQSLICLAVFVLLLWEYRVHRYKERFYEGSNDALKCKNCTDFLCGRKHPGTEGKCKREILKDGQKEK